MEKRFGDLDALRQLGRFDELGDAEVDELGRSLGGDQDVARLEVTVHDEVLVSEVDGNERRLDMRGSREEGERVPKAS
ncbi:MAG TPA: hypothetical protein VGV61_01170 [Thermoanaerobaculia bacterium]|nr:hypothetical protein [Thermoanaerobaculia bacterium]